MKKNGLTGSISLLAAICIVFCAVAPVVQAAAFEKTELRAIALSASGQLISDVAVSGDSFNPAAGQRITLSFSLAKDALVTVNAYDPDDHLIAVLADNTAFAAGKNEVVWTGRDTKERIVPDEAYYFTIEAKTSDGKAEIWDPTVFSGGVEHEIQDVEISREKGIVSFAMPETGRVSVRLGTAGGPLFKTLSNWAARTPGRVTLFWDGFDQDRLFSLWEDKRFKMVILYFSLPQSTVVTYGNSDMDYYRYRQEIGLQQPLKPERPRAVDPSLRISPHWKYDRLWDRPPEIIMTFPQAPVDENGIPLLKGRALVHVDIAPQDKGHFQDMQYEICFFLDGAYYAEEELGYAPYNWVWETGPVEEGERILTVNLSSYKDQLGVISRRIRIVK
jgi:hypothetical protein